MREVVNINRLPYFSNLKRCRLDHENFSRDTRNESQFTSYYCWSVLVKLKSSTEIKSKRPDRHWTSVTWSNPPTYHMSLGHRQFIYCFSYFFIHFHVYFLRSLRKTLLNFGWIFNIRLKSCFCPDSKSLFLLPPTI